MFILSAGMQKSGSAYFYNIINELLIKAGSKDARKIKEERGLDDLMKDHNNNIGELSLTKFKMLYQISIEEGTFAVKTHRGPNQFIRDLSEQGMIKIIYSYRDPRDVLISAIDHGKKILAEGDDHTFAKIVRFDKACHSVINWLGIWEKYADMSGIMMIKYEEMMKNPAANITLIEDFIDISLNTEQREEIVWNFSKDNPDGDRRGMHFNKAKIYRYKTEMSREQKKKCEIEFGNYLEAMGYRVSLESRFLKVIKKGPLSKSF